MKKNKLPYHNKSGFKVPEGYFEALEGRVLDSVTAAQEKVLPRDKKETGFKVPENYFENFEAELFERIDRVEEKRKTPKIISLFNKESFYYAAGAAAVFVAIITTFFTHPSQNIGFEDLDMLTLEGYIHESIELSTNDISHYLSEGDFGLAPSGGTDVDEDAVIEYLTENMEEPSILYNED